VTSSSSTISTFAEALKKSRLLSEDQIQARMKEFQDASVDLSDPKSLAQAFVASEDITKWQADKLLSGKHKGFFLGKYKLLGHIGTGGMSSVYLAEHIKMGDKRAVKVLPKSRVSDTSYLHRFQREARAIAALNHPNIVRAYDIDNDGDLHYIVMEYVDGDDLQTWVKRDGPFSFERAAEVILQAARGLQHAHDCGMIHRDVKPANLLIDSQRKIKLLDMGLALYAEQGETSLTIEHNENVLGTADYLAPEQALNSHKVDHRADIYGLGCTLYFMLAGHPPFPEGTLAQRIAKHQTEMPESLRKVRPDCPGELEGIVVKMIQKEPQYRYQSATAVAEVLEEWLVHAQVASQAGTPESRQPAASGGAGGGSDVEPSGSDFQPPQPPGSAGSKRGSPRSGGSSSATSEHDTVSNERGDTLAGSRSSLIIGSSLSPSDSGRLVKVRKQNDFLIDSGLGSAIDLEQESGYKSPRQKPAKAAASRPAGSRQPAGSPRGGGETAATAARGTQGKRPAGSQPVNASTLSGWLVFTFIAIFVLAITIGFVLAKLTS